MDSVVGEDPTLPLDFDYSVSMSQLPDVTSTETPLQHKHRYDDHLNDLDVSHRSDPGPNHLGVVNNANGRMSPITSRNMKDYGTQISDLKKENFSLKLRIFYMEERIQQQYDGDQEQLLKTNIELKVECDSLRRELDEKHGLLVKALGAVASLETQQPEEVRRARNETEREMMQLRELMNEKVRSAENEARIAQQDADMLAQQTIEFKKQLEDQKAENQTLAEALKRMKDERERTQPQKRADPALVAEVEAAKNLQRKIDQLHKDLKDKDCTISQLKNSLSSKQTLIELLNDEKQDVASQATEAEQILIKLKETEAELDAVKEQKEEAHNTYQDHITEQQERLDDFELATKQMSEELEKRETEVKDLREGLRQSDNAVEDLTKKMEFQAAEAKVTGDKLAKDVHKRDKAITGLTQVVRKKDEEIASLQANIKGKEIKTSELASNVRKLEFPTNSPTKDAFILQLREQLREADAALQDALDDKLRADNEKEKCLREINQQSREKDRLLERLRAQISDYDDSVAALDCKIREKDEELQDLATKYKELLKDLQLKEDDRLRVLRERDELLEQCEDEKKRFEALSKKLLKRSTEDLDCSFGMEGFDALEQIRDLENKLKTKTQALTEASVARDQALASRDAILDQVEKTLRLRDEELDKNKRTMGLKDVEIRQLKDTLRDKGELMHDLENEQGFEIEKLSRQNTTLKEALQSREEELEKLKSKQGRYSEDPYASYGRSSLDRREAEGLKKEIQTLRNEMDQLNKELNCKDNELKALQSKSSHSSLYKKSDESDNDATSEGVRHRDTNITYNYHTVYQNQPSLKRNRSSQRFPTRNNRRSVHYDQANTTTASDDSTGEPARASFNWSRQMALERRKKGSMMSDRFGERTIDTTFGLPLDQTSYLDMPDEFRGDSEEGGELAHLTVPELKDLLRRTRDQLSDAIRDLADTRKICHDQADNIKRLDEILNVRDGDYDRLMKQYRQAIEEKMSKESEVLDLLARIKDNREEAAMAKKRAATTELDGQLSENESVLSSVRSRRRSGDESDGMSSLRRKELRDVIFNLKTKLGNAEKVNELLKRQVHMNMEADGQDRSTFNPQLIIDLSDEVERLQQRLREKERDISSAHDQKKFQKKCSGIPTFRSKLPLPIDFKVSQRSAENPPMRSELERARMLNRKLNERLAATEQTVRQQADKLNKCRAALREAGIASPPVSPLRAARSVPNLFRSPEVEDRSEQVTHDSINADATKRRNRGRGRSVSTDTNDACTQTQTSEDSGVASVSPKSEQKFNSLIQAQAKELSSLRQQLKKSRDTCTHLHTGMDLVTRYINSLLASAGESVDPMLVDGVAEELERSKRLVAKLRKNLTDPIEESTLSETDSDSSVLAVPLTDLAAVTNQQIQSLKNELNEKKKLISELEEKLRHQESKATFLEKQNRLNPELNGATTAGKWLSTPNLTPYTISSSKDPSVQDIFKKQQQRPSSVEIGFRPRSNQGFLTPSSLRFSEDEMLLHHNDSSRLSTRMSGHDDERYASLPNMLDDIQSKQRASWPTDRNRTSPNNNKRKSMPLYQRTVAITEYLPPGAKRDSSQRDNTLRHRLATASDTEECTASYGGVWAEAASIPKKYPGEHRNSLKFTPSPNTSRLEIGGSSCDEESNYKHHKLSREVDRLRRRLSDSKKLNRSLKEELDLSNRSLLRTKDTLVPGYQRSAHHSAELLTEHLSEIRGLRQRLERSIATNDKLREKLEGKLMEANTSNQEHVAANIYLNGENKNKRTHSDLVELQKKLNASEAMNRNLTDRLRSEERAHSSYEDAIREMKSLQQHLADKSNQTELLSKHVGKLQQELEKQTNLSGKLGGERNRRDDQLNRQQDEMKRMEGAMNRIAGEGKKAEEKASRLSEDLRTARSQLNDSHQLIDSLKAEVALYEKVQRNHNKKQASPYSKTSSPGLDLTELLREIKSLRIQLERSIDANAALRRQLEEQLRNPIQPDEPSRNTTINIHHLSPRMDKSSTKPSPYNARRKLKLDYDIGDDSVLMTPPASASSGGEEHRFHFHQEPKKTGGTDNRDKPYYSERGSYTVCQSEDFVHLQQALVNSGLLARKADNQIAQKIKHAYKHSPEKKILRDLSTLICSLWRHLDDSDQILQRFWTAELPDMSDVARKEVRSNSFSSGVATGGHISSSESAPYTFRRTELYPTGDFSVNAETNSLRREVGKLRRRLTTQDRLLQTTVERLHSTNQMKEGIEHAIVAQLSRTHEVLRKARGNLEANVQDPTSPRPLQAS